MKVQQFAWPCRAFTPGVAFPSAPKGTNRKPLPILLWILFTLAVNMFKSYFRLFVSVELELKVSINEAYLPR